MTAPQVSCANGTVLDDLAITATGGTSLRYDSTANQFIYNWQSPRKAGSCYSVTVNFTDGTATTALFQLR